MVGRMIARGYAEEFAQRCFDQIKGFGEYGFPESHAASFAHLVYVSAWLKPLPGVFARAAELPADGLLCPRPDRARCARAWGGGAPARYRVSGMGLRAGGEKLLPWREKVDRAARRGPG